MKNKRPLIYLLTALAFAIIVLAIENPYSSRVNDVPDQTFYPGFDSAQVKSVKVTQLLDGAKLMRDGDRWLVREISTPIKKELLLKEGREDRQSKWLRADRIRVNSALGGFGGLPQGVMVSDNMDRRSLYQVEATGLRVQLIGDDDKPIADVIIGKNGPDLASSYIRKADEDEVYLVRRSLAGLFTPIASDWRERKIWVINPDDITAIDVRSYKGSFTAARDKDGKWKDVDEEEMKSLLIKVSDIRAKGFPIDPDIKLACEPEFILTLKRSNGEDLELTVYCANSKELYPAKLKGVDEIYYLSHDFVASIPISAPKSTDN
ncbi:MAG: DUF4340 domain-containing protein [Pseudomonadota bacterium]